MLVFNLGVFMEGCATGVREEVLTTESKYCCCAMSRSQHEPVLTMSYTFGTLDIANFN